MRAYRWLELLDLPAVIHDYLGTTTAGARDLLAHPLRCARAELQLRSAHTFGRAFVQRETSPLSTGALEERILRSADLGIYDLDDGFPWDTTGSMRRLFPKARKAERAAKAADCVIVANKVLADWAEQLADNVRVIPSCVEPADYTRKETYELHDPPIIGWIGSQWTLPYLRTIESALQQLHAQTGARLELIGPLHGALGALAPFADRIAWSEQEAFTRPARWDIAVAPLKHGPFERARSSYKLLEYAAAGVPSIGSRWGATGDIVHALGAHGADSPDEWLAACRELLDASASDRAALGLAQRAAAERGYSYNAWADEWRSVVSG